MGSDHDQGKCRTLCKFITRDEDRINIKPIKIAYVDSEKDTYDGYQSSIVQTLNDGLNI